MQYREQVAHHEAAHAVMALIVGHGLSHHGMNIDAPTSVAGAFGQTGVMTFSADLSQTADDQFEDLGCLLAVTLAGAASDARIKGVELEVALEAQPGDLQVAKGLCSQYPFAQGEGETVALRYGLQIAASKLEAEEAWEAVCAVARACLAANGQLSKKQIEDVALPILGIKPPVGLIPAPD